MSKSDTEQNSTSKWVRIEGNKASLPVATIWACDLWVRSPVFVNLKIYLKYDLKYNNII